MNSTAIKVTAALAAGFGAGVAIAAATQRDPFYFHGRTVIITGGSRGLGLLLARQLAREGASLALLARDPVELDRAVADLASRGAEAIAVPCDVADRDQVERAVQRVAEHFGRIDVLINNAGIIQVGPLEHLNIDDFKNAMAVHAFGPLYTTLAALPHMRRQGGGRIVNISSIGGKVAVPHMIPYTASKFALVGLSDGLRAELRRHNVLVTTVCPGLMRTGSPINALFKGKHRKEFAWFAISDSLPLITIDAERAAEKIIDACRRGAARLIITPQAKAAALFSELCPGTTGFFMSMANRLLPSPDPGHSAEIYTGRQSRSSWAPSILTRLSDRAAIENNEQPAPHTAPFPSRT